MDKASKTKITPATHFPPFPDFRFAVSLERIKIWHQRTVKNSCSSRFFVLPLRNHCYGHFFQSRKIVNGVKMVTQRNFTNYWFVSMFGNNAKATCFENWFRITVILKAFDNLLAPALMSYHWSHNRICSASKIWREPRKNISHVGSSCFGYFRYPNELFWRCRFLIFFFTLPLPVLLVSTFISLLTITVCVYATSLPLLLAASKIFHGNANSYAIFVIQF